MIRGVRRPLLIRVRELPLLLPKILRRHEYNSPKDYPPAGARVVMTSS